ncbi:MAG: DUF983 domain-containing protein [Rickettsiales bacterium]|jgi:uncharacterized protein (DUF983 family)
MRHMEEYRRGVGIPIRPMLWGLRKRCPCCGEAPIYRTYLKPVDECGSCGTKLAIIRTDDIAPYFTILIVGHLIAPLLLFIEQGYAPPIWVHVAIWPALVLSLTLWLLPRVKGAAVGVMWHLGLKGDETQ